MAFTGHVAAAAILVDGILLRAPEETSIYGSLTRPCRPANCADGSLKKHRKTAILETPPPRVYEPGRRKPIAGDSIVVNSSHLEQLEDCFSIWLTLKFLPKAFVLSSMNSIKSGDALNHS